MFFVEEECVFGESNVVAFNDFVVLVCWRVGVLVCWCVCHCLGMVAENKVRQKHQKAFHVMPVEQQL